MNLNLQDTLSALLDNPQSAPDPDWVLAVTDTFPTFFLPALLLLKRAPQSVDADTAERLKSLIILNCSDREALADYIDIIGADWANLYPQPSPKKQKTTDEAIDAFIATYGNSSPEEDAMLENLLFNPVPTDYFADTDTPLDPENPLSLPPELAPSQPIQPEEPTDTHDSIAPANNTAPANPEDTIDNTDTTAPTTSSDTIDTIDNTTPTNPSDNIDNIDNTAPTTPEDIQPSEPPKPKPRQKRQKNRQKASEEEPIIISLAKIYIKQHKYARAYEIISNLSLKYPEKSIYFADQLRFLRKLMIIQQLQPSDKPE